MSDIHNIIKFRNSKSIISIARYCKFNLCMKKVFFSLISTILLFSSCGSDEIVEETFSKGEGGLKGTISFANVANTNNIAPAMRSASASASAEQSATAVPPTSWENIKQTHMFLYDASGKIAYSYVMKPSATLTKFQWTNIPEGTYTLALVGNIQSSTDNVATSLDGGLTPTVFTAYNTPSLLINKQVYIDLKKTALPAQHAWGGSHVGYAEASEIFTAYATNVVIKEGETTDLTATPLQLSREVSLMRTRFNTAGIPEEAKVRFDTETSCIAIQRQPVGFGLKHADFAGGIYQTPSSDANRIMIAASGTNTFIKENPTFGAIIGTGGFTMWRDVKVLPNAAIADNKAASADASVDRKYYLIISGQVGAGYRFADGTVARGNEPVYWYATVNGVFAKNKIRLVNVSLKSAGYPEVPVEPEKEGGLVISVSAPEAWDSVVESEDISV